MVPHKLSLLNVVASISSSGLTFPRVPLEAFERNLHVDIENGMCFAINAWIRLETRLNVCVLNCEWYPGTSLLFEAKPTAPFKFCLCLVGLRISVPPSPPKVAGYLRKSSGPARKDFNVFRRRSRR
jgi:hypothetical protein